jgi:hypothetical protein
METRARKRHLGEGACGGTDGGWSAGAGGASAVSLDGGQGGHSVLHPVFGRTDDGAATLLTRTLNPYFLNRVIDTRVEPEPSFIELNRTL